MCERERERDSAFVLFEQKCHCGTVNIIFLIIFKGADYRLCCVLTICIFYMSACVSIGGMDG